VALPIMTDRLKLRAYRAEDIPAIHATLYGDPDVRRHTGGISSIAETRAYVERYMADHERDGYAYWAVIERETGELVGEAGLKAVGEAAPDDIELGYAFRQACWGLGYATEIGRAVLDEAFGALGLDRVAATVHQANAGSRHVLAKLGFTAAGTVVIGETELLYLVRDRH
jgi:ribosomal-protein-alanine N-acetyltransferase